MIAIKKCLEKIVKKKLKPGICFIIVADNQHKNLYNCIMSLVNIADEIILLDVTSPGNSLKLIQEIKKGYPSVLKIYKRNPNKKRSNKDIDYFKWGLNKVTKFNVVNWEENCVADTAKLKKIVETKNLKERNDKFFLYLEGETIISKDDSFFSLKTENKLNNLLCYSKLNYTLLDKIGNKRVPSSKYLESSIMEEYSEPCFYKIINKKPFKQHNFIKERLPINNLFLKREPKKSKPLFLIGSGPSLREQDISKLKNCYTMSFNRSFIAFDDWGFQPTYFAALDHVVNKDNKDEFINLILNSSIKRFFFPNDNTSKKFFKRKKSSIIDIYGGNPDGPDLNFSTHLTTANTGLFGLQIAIGLLGFTEIYLLGCDASYKEEVKGIQKKNGVYISTEDNDSNHFRKDYFGKGTVYNKPNSMKWHYPAWKSFFEVHLKNRGNNINVYNCSPTGKLTFFKFQDFNIITKNIKSFEIEKENS